VAIIASARQTNEEPFPAQELAAKFGAVDRFRAAPRRRRQLLVDADKIRTATARSSTGLAPRRLAPSLPGIADAIRRGNVRTLIVFGEDVTRHGIGADLLGQWNVGSSATFCRTRRPNWRHYCCRLPPHAEKRGSFTNVKGRVQRFLKRSNLRARARPEWEFLDELVYDVTGQNGYVTIEGLFNLMAVKCRRPRLDWAGLVTWA